MDWWQRLVLHIHILMPAYTYSDTIHGHLLHKNPELCVLISRGVGLVFFYYRCEFSFDTLITLNPLNELSQALRIWIQSPQYQLQEQARKVSCIHRW